jgi:diguanylate cyclase (GGDEF)-like protein/PAS domain S-box-containing protein
MLAQPPVPNVESHRVLQAIPAGALVIDRQGAIVSVNDAFLALLGYQATQVVGRTFDELILSTDAAPIADLLNAPAALGRPTPVRFVRERAGPLLTSVAFSSFVEASRSEPQLLAVILGHASVEAGLPLDLLTDEALGFAHVASWMLDTRSGRVHVSRSWRDLWGFDAEPAMDLEQCLLRIHPLDRDLVRAALDHISEDEPARQVSFRIIRPDGQLRWAESTARLLPPEAGLEGCVYGAVMDITERQAAQQALARYADIVSASSDRIAFVDRGCRILAANTAFLRALRRSQEQIIDRPFKDISGDGQLSTLLYRNLNRCLDQSQIVVEDIREATRDGEPRDSEVRLFPHQDTQGGVTGIVINIRDVTPIRDAERRLLQSAAIYSATSEGVLVTDPAASIVAVNAAFTQITGYTESEVLGQKPTFLTSHWHPYSFFVGMWRRIRRYGSWQGEVWNRRKDGEVYLQRLTIRRVSDSRGKVVNYIGVFAERMSTPETPQRAEYLLHYDALTKLPNRLLFASRVEHAIQLARRKESPLAVFIVDLDHFSHVNSSLGHQIGDELLRMVAWKLREAIRPSDTLARLRADEFALLFEEINRVEEVTEITRRIQAILHTNMDLRGHQVFVTVSIGIVFDTRLECDESAIISQAESVLRRVQRQGGNGFRISSIDPGDAAQEHKRLLGQLRSGLDRGEYQLLYRPRVDMESMSCECAEALISWTQAEIGAVPPERFLPLANDSGFMVELGHWALTAACQQLQTWVREGLPLRGLCINVSEAQLTRGELIRTLKRLIDGHPLIADRLELEFNESMIQRHREQVVETFQGLAELGVRIGLGEVGGGWMAPAVLQRLPVRSLKIHPTFIECLPDSKPDLAVVQALIAMAQALDLEIFADGVRSEAQRQLLLTIGCQQGLGDLFGEPSTPKHFARRLTAHPDPEDPKHFEN